MTTAVEHFVTLFTPVLATLTPVMVAFIAAWGKRWIAENNKEVRDGLLEIKEFIGIHQNHDSIIKSLNDIKYYYTQQINDENWRIAAQERADTLISAIEHILENFTVELNNLNGMKQHLEFRRDRLNKRLIDLLGVDIASKIRPERNKAHRQYEENIETILANTKNHYKEQFAEASSLYLRQMMKDMIKWQQKYKPIKEVS